MEKSIIQKLIILIMLVCSHIWGQEFKIFFIDSPPYKSGFWLFGENTLRIEIKIINNSDTIFQFERFMPSGEGGNPEIYVKNLKTNKMVSLENPLCVDYFYLDSTIYIILKPNETYADTIDIEYLGDLNLTKNVEYELWLEYEARERKNFIKKKKYKLFDKKLKSNILKFTK